MLKTYKHIFDYLKQKNIYYEEDVYEGAPGITMSFNSYPNCPSGRIKSCIYFNPSSTEVRVYYSEPGSQAYKRTEHLSDLYRLINFLNAQVFPMNMDGAENMVYNPSHLLQPRQYLEMFQRSL